MAELTTTEQIAPMSPAAVAKVRALESAALQRPQVPIETLHTFHAGLYARTITIPAGVLLTGALIKIPTLLIFNGDAIVYGEGGGQRLTGYHVLSASAGRKQAFCALADTQLTMVFATDALTVEAAEAEFTAEAELLLSRRDDMPSITRRG